MLQSTKYENSKNKLKGGVEGRKFVSKGIRPPTSELLQVAQMFPSAQRVNGGCSAIFPNDNGNFRTVLRSNGSAVDRFQQRDAKIGILYLNIRIPDAVSGTEYFWTCCHRSGLVSFRYTSAAEDLAEPTFIKYICKTHIIMIIDSTRCWRGRQQVSRRYF